MSSVRYCTQIIYLDCSLIVVTVTFKSKGDMVQTETAVPVACKDS